MSGFSGDVDQKAASPSPGSEDEAAQEGDKAEETPTTEEGWALLRQARKLIILIVGSTVVSIGVAMLVLPGPAFVVIPAGIAILATEFAWARRLLRQVRARVRLAARKARRAREARSSGGRPSDN